MLDLVLAFAEGTPLDRLTWSYSYRGSLFLIGGGILILGILTIVLLVQSTLFGTPGVRGGHTPRSVMTRPQMPPAPIPGGSDGRFAREATHRPADAHRLGRFAGIAVASPDLDGVLDRFVEAGLGDPRVVLTRSRAKVVRTVGCRTCAQAARADRPVCEYERGFLEGGLGGVLGGGIRVRETRCRARGDAVCDFEVMY